MYLKHPHSRHFSFRQLWDRGPSHLLTGRTLQVDLRSPSQSLSSSLGLGDDTQDMLSTFCENYLYLSEGFKTLWLFRN